VSTSSVVNRPEPKRAKGVYLAFVLGNAALLLPAYFIWMRYQLLETTVGDWAVLAILACLAGVAAGVRGYHLAVRTGRSRRTTVETFAVVALVYAVGVGGAILLAANAWLDSSPARVLKMTVASHSSCSNRAGGAVYTLAGGPDVPTVDHTVGLRVAGCGQYSVGQHLALTIGGGALGRAWIVSLRPDTVTRSSP